jgi:hypothetical protein
MAFKLIKQEKKKQVPVDDKTLIAFLLEDHNHKISTRSLNVLVDDNSIPAQVPESKKEFDFFLDEKKDEARRQAIYDLENSIINKPVIQKEAQVVDRRKSKRK